VAKEEEEEDEDDDEAVIVIFSAVRGRREKSSNWAACSQLSCSLNSEAKFVRSAVELWKKE
jgi:hypothetical protein